MQSKKLSPTKEVLHYRFELRKIWIVLIFKKFFFAKSSKVVDIKRTNKRERHLGVNEYSHLLYR